MKTFLEKYLDSEVSKEDGPPTVQELQEMRELLDKKETERL